MLMLINVLLNVYVAHVENEKKKETKNTRHTYILYIHFAHHGFSMDKGNIFVVEFHVFQLTFSFAFNKQMKHLYVVLGIFQYLLLFSFTFIQFLLYTIYFNICLVWFGVLGVSSFAITYIYIFI